MENLVETNNLLVQQVEILTKEVNHMRNLLAEKMSKNDLWIRVKLNFHFSTIDSIL